MKKILIAAILLNLVACQNKQGKVEKHLSNGTIAIDSLDNLPVRQMKELRYIPLETNDDILLDDIRSISFVNECFHVVTQQKVVVFDKKGKFVYSIDKKGNGPGEYTSLSNVDINALGDVYLLDGTNGKVIKYSSNGTRFEEYFTEESFIDFAALNDSVFYLANLFENGEMDIALAKYSPVSKELTTLSTYDGLFSSNMIFRLSPVFFRSAGQLYFNKLFSSELSVLTENGLNSYMNFPSAHWVGKEQIKKWSENRETLYTEDRKLLRGLSAYCETDDYIFISFNRFQLNNSILIDKTTGELTKAQFLGGKVLSFRGIFCAADSYFVSLTSTDEEDIKHILEHDKDMLPEEREVLSQLSEDDNPVLLLMKF